MKEKLQALKEKLNPKVAVIGGALVITTSLGTCHLKGNEIEAEQEEAPAAAPAETPSDPGPEILEEEAPSSDA